ncbi:hypothetical protein [Herbaspirillum sp. SJZ099]|uniref:hypothetical protein n=1 Tax=Herbaspirillum sp. SJZ099 TaxID=2572916 RepID=UPI0011A873CE|nr:hypothetical protein [Herbaspirillum sp. SJZ099]
MRTIRLLAEYLAPPFFDPSIENMGHIDPSDLPISKNLCNEINDWNQEFQKTFCDFYPPDSGFPTPDAELDFKRRGAVLAEKLQAELGKEFHIEYCYTSESGG